MRKLLLLCAPLLAAACATGHVEEPAYSLRLSDGAFQVREYAPTIVAETTVAGDAWDTRFEGFGPLADYIFAKGREGEKIAMTAPVTQTPREKIAMTAPVTQQETAGGAWTIAFTMPADYSMATLPKPASPDVKLVEHPARTMAVLGFSGVASDAEMESARRKLMQHVAAASLVTKGEPVFAFYDPPWTPSFFRRNEVMVEVVQAG
jgi:hypothetical protein